MRQILLLIALLLSAGGATTYIQTSSTGAAPWRSVKDSVSQAHFADSALKSDSGRVSHIADSAKRSGWAPLDTTQVQSIVSDSVSHCLPLTAGSGKRLTGTLYGTDFVFDSARFVGINGGLVIRPYPVYDGIWCMYGSAVNPTSKNWSALFAHDGDEASLNGSGFSDLNVAGEQKLAAYSDHAFSTVTFNAPKLTVTGGTQKGYLKADGSVDSSGIFSGVIDSSRVAGVSDSAKKSGWSRYADTARSAGISDSARLSGTASNALSLGGIVAAQYGTLAQDTAIAKRVISDSLTANTRAWTTLAAAKSSIHDSLGVERAFDSVVARNVAHDTAAVLRTYASNISIPHTQVSDWGTYINQPLLTTSSPTFSRITSGVASIGTFYGGQSSAWFGRSDDYTSYRGYLVGTSDIMVNQPSWNSHIYLAVGGVNAIDAITSGGTAATTSVSVSGNLSVSGSISATGGVSTAGTSNFGGIKIYPTVVYSTNAARTIDLANSTHIWTVAQSSTQTIPNGTVSGETIYVKNAQTGSDLTLSGTINVGSSVVPARQTAILVWNGSSWY